MLKPIALSRVEKALRILDAKTYEGIDYTTQNTASVSFDPFEVMVEILKPSNRRPVAGSTIIHHCSDEGPEKELILSAVSAIWGGDPSQLMTLEAYYHPEDDENRWYYRVETRPNRLWCAPGGESVRDVQHGAIYDDTKSYGDAETYGVV